MPITDLEGNTVLEDTATAPLTLEERIEALEKALHVHVTTEEVHVQGVALRKLHAVYTRVFGE
jgi:hypothetical protein